MPDAGGYELVGRGSDLAIDVQGPDAAACLSAAVEGLAAFLADVPAEAPRRAEAVELSADSPPALLRALVEEAVVRLDADGEIVVGLEDAQVADGRLAGDLVLVALEEADVHGVAPKAATWHDLRLEPEAEGWAGSVMLDL